MMERRNWRRATACLVVGCLVLVSTAPALAETGGAETPEALVERVKKAAENEDFGELMACLEPEGRAQISSMMYLMATMMVGFSMMSVEMGGQMGEAMAESMEEGTGEGLSEEQKAEMEAQKAEARAQVDEIRESYNALVKKYGLPEMTEGEEPAEAEIEKLLQDIDHGAFLRDVMAFLESMPGDDEDEVSAGPPSSPFQFGEGKLTDLEIDGDRATGKVDGQDVTFVRVDGRWYVAADMFGGP